ncbi:MAG: hypothetical protein NZ480_08205 [Bdellovibrionaceae bacterium]|nr:hypothetical protein [Pseudobdellovibrionaceae bacterium]MDW8189521.1 hypothetical protein [Pseudobdellovibrionaceae bacterium]
MPSPKEAPKMLEVSREEMGRSDTLRYNVNYFLLEENYDRAIEEIEAYRSRDFDLPQYKEKINPYLNYAIDLIHAIRAKNGLFKNASLTRSKQQEIQLVVRGHYQDLQNTFKKIDQIRNQLQLEDMKSTIWVAQAFVFTSVVVAMVYLFRELGAFSSNFKIIWDELTEDFVEWLSRLLF